MYSTRLESGSHVSPFPERTSVTATEVAVTVTEMLDAVDVELFELGMWQIWGRPS